MASWKTFFAFVGRPLPTLPLFDMTTALSHLERVFKRGVLGRLTTRLTRQGGIRTHGYPYAKESSQERKILILLHRGMSYPLYIISIAYFTDFVNTFIDTIFCIKNMNALSLSIIPSSNA